MYYEHKYYIFYHSPLFKFNDLLYQAIVSKYIIIIHIRDGIIFEGNVDDPDVLESAVVKLADGWDRVEGLMTSTENIKRLSLRLFCY